MIDFVEFTCHLFSWYSFWVNLLHFILWFSLIFHCLKAGFVQGTKWWFPIWPPEIMSIVNGSYWHPIDCPHGCLLHVFCESKVWVVLVNSNSGLCIVHCFTLNILLYSIMCHSWPCYNDTRPYEHEAVTVYSHIKSLQQTNIFHIMNIYSIEFL